MKKFWLLTTILICWLLLTGCNNSLNEDIIPNDKAETNIVLNFELLTGSFLNYLQVHGKILIRWIKNEENGIIIPKSESYVQIISIVNQ